MDRTLQHTHILPNFDSAYNVPLHSPTYSPLSSSRVFSTFSDHRSSPLFHRCRSPPPRRPVISPESTPKFSFDLYKMNENTDKYDHYISSTHRPLSPTTSDIVHHHRIRSSSSSPTGRSPTLSKLRRINEELSRSLARNDFTDPSSSLTTSAPHYHIHHYPLAQYPPPRHRSPSTSDKRSSSIELPLPSNIHKARVVYKIHVPQRPRQEKSSRYKPTSDRNTGNEQIEVDLYPTREQAFVTQRRKHSQNQSPWVVNGKSLHYDSNSDASASQTPRGFYYGDKPIRSSRHEKRPDSASLDESPSTKHRERVWHPSSKSSSKRPPKHFESTSHQNQTHDETESEPESQRKPSSDRVQRRNTNPRSKAKSPTVNGLHRPSESESKPGTPVKRTTHVTPTKPKEKPISKNESHVSTRTKKREKSRSPSPIEVTPRQPPPTLPKRPVPEPDRGAKSTIKNGALVHGDNAKSNHDQNPTPPPIAHTNENNNKRSESRTPNPPPAPPQSSTTDRKPRPPKPKTESEDEDDENDHEVAQSFDIQKWLSDASKDIQNPSANKKTVIPSIPPQPLPAKPKPKSPPRRKQQPPSPPSDENLYKPPFGPKRTEQKPPTPPPVSTSTGGTDEVDDFFN